MRLKKATLKQVRIAMKKSWEKNVELGVKLCGTKKDMKLGTLCFGEVCAVDIKNCRDKPMLGSLHTHPHSQPYLNRHDVSYGISTNEKVMCVCGNSKAPGIALDFEQPEPFENLVCRCAKIDTDKKTYNQIRKIQDKYKPIIKAQIEEIRQENKKLEKEGKSWRTEESAVNTKAYQEMMPKVEPLVSRLLAKAKTQVINLEE